MKRILPLLLILMLLAQPFGCALAEFTLPSGLRDIQEEAFAGNKLISGNLELPENTQTVGDAAFADTGVFALLIPSATTRIGSGVLEGADTAYVVVGNDAAELADAAFSGVPVIVGGAGSTAQRYAQANGVRFYDADTLVYEGGFAYALDRGARTAQLAFPQVRTHGDVVIPQAVSGCPVVSVSEYALTGAQLSALSLPRPAYDTLPDQGVNWPDAAITAYEVTIAKAPLSETELYTYAGSEHALFVTEALPADAVVTWSADSSLVSFCAPEDGREIVMDGAAVSDAVRANAVVAKVAGEGEAVVTCSILYADGTQAEGEIPVHAKPWMSFADAKDRHDLNPGWYYHSEYEDLMPELTADLWPQDEGLLCISAKSADEVLFDTELSNEGQHVMGFVEYEDEDGSLITAAHCGWPGTAKVTYTAALDKEAANTVLPEPVSSGVINVTVNHPDITALLEPQELEVHIYDTGVHVGFGWDDPFDVQHESLSSSDESVFLVTPSGRIIPVGEGEATLTYTIHCYGTVSTAETTVRVSGSIAALDPSEITLKVGESLTVRPVLPEGIDGNGYGIWSSNPQVADVTYYGNVIALSAGTARICYTTGYAGGSDIYAECVVTVVDDEARMSLNADSAALYAGESFQLEASFAEGEEPVEIRWTSEDEGAVFVSEDGLVTVVDGGWAISDYVNVYCTAVFADGREETLACVIGAERPLVELIDVYGYYAMEKGEERVFNYLLRFAGGMSAEDFDVAIVSDDEQVAAVGENGTIIAVGAGKTAVHVIVSKDGRVVARGFSYVHVGEEIRLIDPQEDWIDFNLDHYLFLPPMDGEEIRESFGTRVSDEALYHYYYPVFSEVSDPNDIFEIDEDGNFAISGEGTVEIFLTMRQYDDLVEVPEGFGSTAKLTVAQPSLEITVADFDGANAAPLSDDNPIEVGDRVTIALAGIPEDIEHHYINLEYDGHHFGEIARGERELVLIAVRTGETGVYAEGEASNGMWYWLEKEIEIVGEAPEYAMSEPAAALAVGEVVEIWPDFSWSEGYFTTSDDSVVVPVEGEFPLVEAVGTGSAVLTAHCISEDQEVTATVLVTVVENDWGIAEFCPQPVMIAGHTYSAEAHIRHNGWNRPELTFSFSGEGVAEAVLDDHDEWNIEAHRAGRVTVTMTASKGGRTETATAQISVIEPDVTFADGVYAEMFAGDTILLHIDNRSGKEISSVEGGTSHTGVVSIEVDEDAPLNVMVTAADIDYGVDAMVYATVTFTDGTQETASVHLFVRPLYEDHLNIWFHNDYYELAANETAWLEFDYDSHSEVTGVRFESSDESVATVSAYGVITAVAPGDAQITVTVSNRSETISCEAHVHVRGFAMELSPGAMTLQVGDAAYVAQSFSFPWEGCVIDRERCGFWSENESVVMVDHLGLIMAVAPGSTRVWADAWVKDSDEHAVAYTDVTVTAGEGGLTLSETEITLRPREEFALEAYADGEITGEITWTVSNEGMLSVEDGVVRSLNRVIDNGSMVESVIATAVVDGVETSVVCKVTLLPSVVNIIDSPNWYQISVGEKVIVPYTLSFSDPNVTAIATFVSEDESVATIDENGVITGVAPGRCIIRLNLHDEMGKLLCSGGAYVYVDTDLPTPYDEDADFGFRFPAYYLDVNDEYRRNAGPEESFYENGELGVYYPVRFASDDESVVEIHDDGGMTARGEGETTVRAWFEGFEDAAVEAKVYVRMPYLTFDKELDENGRPIVSVGETLTITVENLPPQDVMPIEYLECNGAGDHLQPVGVEGNSITLLAIEEHEDLWSNVWVDLGEFWRYHIEMNVSIRAEQEQHWRLEQKFIQAAPGEEFVIWPSFEWQEGYFTTSDDSVIVPVEDNFPALRTVGNGIATVTAHCQNGDQQIEASAYVIVRDGYWALEGLGDWENVHTMVVGHEYGEMHNQHAHVECTYYYWPEITYSTSDESILRAEHTEHGWLLTALRRGVVDLTITAERDGEVHSLTKTITVVEPEVRFMRSDFSLRPGATDIIPLVFAGDKEIESITYACADENFMTVYDAAEEYGAPAMGVTCVGRDGRTSATATVRFADGSIAYATVQLWMMENYEVYFNLHGNNLNLSTEPWGEHGRTDAAAELFWDTNAALTVDGGTDTMEIEWFIDGIALGEEGFGSGVVEFDGFDESAPYNSRPILRAVGEGGVSVEARVTLYDIDGNYICDRNCGFGVWVSRPHAQLWFERDVYEVRQGDWMFLSAWYDLQNTGLIRSTTLTSDNPDIARFDVHGNLYGVAPGETDVHETIDINGYTFTATTHVVVTGVELRTYNEHQSVGVGETIALIAFENAQGETIRERWWWSGNEAAAQVTGDGTVYGVAPGEAVILYNVRTDEKEYSLAFRISVYGDEPAFRLDQTYLELWPEHEAQLGVIYTGEGEIDEGSIAFTVSSDVISVDEHGLVTVNGGGGHTPTYARVDCTATIGGEAVSANCLVAVLPQSLRICENQFGTGRWQFMNVGERMGLWEQVSRTDGVYTSAEISIDDEDIVTFDYSTEEFVALKEGQTTAHFTAWVIRDGERTGEHYTRDLILRVGGYVEPEKLTPEKELIVIHRHDGEGHNGWTFEPQFSDREVRTYSDNPSIVETDEHSGRIYPRNPGRTTVRLECPEYPELNTSYEVLVLPDLRVGEVTGRTVFTPGETVELALLDENGEPWWDEAIESVTYDPSGYPDSLIRVEGNRWSNFWNGGVDGVWVNAQVVFSDGSRYNFDNRCVFSITEENPYFYIYPDKLHSVESLTGFAGDTFGISIITNVEGDHQIDYRSTDPSVAAIDEYAWVTLGDFGEAEIIAEAHIGGEIFTDTLSVRVIPVQEPNFSIDPQTGLIKVGEVIQLFISDQSDCTITSFHEFTSMDESILEPVLDESGTPYYGQFRALKAGTCEIVCRQVNGHCDEAKTGYASATYYVINDAPAVWFDNNYFELRVDQQAVVPLCIDLKNSGKDIESITYACENEGALEMEADGQQVILRGLDAAQDTMISATVVFTDGSEITVTAFVNMISNEEVWVEPYADELYLNTAEWSEMSRKVQWLSWRHNASFFDEPGMGSDKAWIEWSIDDESIARFDGFFTRGDGTVAPWNNGPMVKAVSAGETFITATLTVTDKDDNFICERTLDIPVYVNDPHGEVWFNRDWYEIDVNRSEYLEWDFYIENASDIDSIRYESDDENVAVVDVHGNVYGVNPGETDVRVIVIMNGVEFGASAHVVVNGVSLSLYQDEIQIPQGGTGTLIVFMDDHGIGTYEQRWETSDPSVATVDSTGIVYGVAQGQALITFGVDTDAGYRSIQAVVHVSGDTPAFDLNIDSAQLWRGQSVQLEILADGEVNEESIVFTSSEAHSLTVDENGLVTAVDCDISKDMFVTVTCSAEMDGKPVSSSALIRILRPQVRSREHQFYDGAWYAMSKGDYLYIWEAYEVIRNGLDVRVSYDSSDDSVVKWNEELRAFGMMAPGVADVYYTLTVYENGEPTGEAYTYSAKIFVNQDVTPETIEPAAEISLYELGNGGGHFDWISTPEYRGCEMYFTSADESIVSFDNPYDNWMRFNGEGRTTVFVDCPGNEHLNFSADVVVIDLDKIELLPVEERENPYQIQPNEFVQLGFFYDGAPFDWFGANVTFEAQHHYDEDRVIVTDDLTLKTNWEGFEEEIHHWVDVIAENGEPMSFCYRFTIDMETPYFYAALENDNRRTGFVDTVGEGGQLDWRTNLDMSEFTVTVESSDENVVTVNNEWFSLVGLGEATLYITAERGEERYTAEFPIRVLDPVYPRRFEVGSDNGVFVVHVGEEVYLHASYEGEFTNPPRHDFTSSNEGVLEPVCDEWGNQFYGTFRAVAPGETMITMNGQYGFEEHGNVLEASATAMFYVIEAQPKVWLQEHYYELRPDETVVLPLYIDDNGCGKEVQAIEYVADAENIVSLEPGFDENDCPFVTVVGVDASQDVGITAKVTFTDGSEQHGNCWINMISNEEVWVNSWISHPDLKYFEGEPDIEEYNIATVWTLWNHNASHFDEIGEGSDQAWIEWFIDGVPMGEEGFGSGILEFAGWHEFEDGTNAPWNNGPRFRTVGSGWVTLSSRLVLTDKDGNYLNECTASQDLYVHEGYLDIWFSEEEIQMFSGEDRNVEWYSRWGNINGIARGEVISSDESVVYADRNWRLYACAPGEATITCRYYTFTGASREASVHVTVTGPTIAWEDEAMNHITLNPGETATLNAVVDMPEDVGFTTNSYWENTNPDVAAINWETGEITALNPGETVVSFWQNLEYYTGEGTTWGECYVYSTITVVDDDPEFTLNETALTLAGDSTFKLEPVYDTALLGEPMSIRWESAGEGGVDENGVVFVNSPIRTFHLAVTCIAEFESGERRATCNVTVNRPTVCPEDWEFGQGNWRYLNRGECLGFFDNITVYDSTVTTEITFESMNEEIATVDEYGNIYAGDVSGETDVVMTIRVLRDGEYIGESYVRNLHIWVDMDTTAEDFAPTYDLFVIPQAWGQHYLPITFYPDFTDRYLEYYSRNEDIVSFDEGCDISEMYFHGGLGYVDIDVVCPDDESLNKTARVLVIDEDAYHVEAQDGRRVLSTGDTVQLELRCDNGELFSLDEVQSFEWRNYYPDGQYELTQDGQLTVLADWDEEKVTMWLHIQFRDDYEMNLPFEFSVDCPND